VKKAVICVLAATWILLGNSALAQDSFEDDSSVDDSGAVPASSFQYTSDSELHQKVPEESEGMHTMFVGGRLMLGMASVFENWGGLSDSDPAGWDDLELKGRVAGGFGIYYQQFLTPMIGLNGGLEFLGKGYKGEYEYRDRTEKARLRTLEIPLGVRINIENIRLGFDLAFAIVLHGEYWRDENIMDSNGIETQKNMVHEVHFTDNDWDNIRRFNVSPRFSAGYAIPVGDVQLIPGAMWEFELLNTAKGEYTDYDVKLRQTNLMFTFAVAYSIDAIASPSADAEDGE
jgi:hypothetical protein